MYRLKSKAKFVQQDSYCSFDETELSMARQAKVLEAGCLDSIRWLMRSLKILRQIFQVLKVHSVPMGVESLAAPLPHRNVKGNPWWGVLSQFPLLRYFSNFTECSNTGFLFDIMVIYARCHCLIWMWFENVKCVFVMSEIFIIDELTNGD